MPEAADVDAVIDKVRAARKGRDRWRQVGPDLRLLRDMGLSLPEISRRTGIAVSTVDRITRTPTGGSSPSGTTSR